MRYVYIKTTLQQKHKTSLIFFKNQNEKSVLFQTINKSNPPRFDFINYSFLSGSVDVILTSLQILHETERPNVSQELKLTMINNILEN